MIRRMLAGIVLVLALGTIALTEAAANPPTPTGFCKKAIENSPSPPPPWIIQDAVFVQYEPTHLMVRCIMTWQGTPNRYLRCTQYVTLWWNGLWTFGERDCQLFSNPQ